MTLKELKAMISEGIAEAFNAKSVDQQKKFSEMIDTKIAEARKPEQREKLVNQAGSEQEFDKKLFIGEYFSALFKRDPLEMRSFYDKYKAVTAAIVTGTEGTAAGVIPTLVFNEVARITSEKSLVMQLCRRFPQNSQVIDLPTVTTGLSVTYTAEMYAKAGTKPVFSKVTFTLKKPAAWVPISDEMIEDSVINIVDLIIELIGEAFATDIDNQAFNSTGGTPYTGIFADTGVNEITMDAGDTAFQNVEADYLSDMIAQIASTAVGGSAFFMHRTIFNIIRKLKDNDGQYIYASPAATNLVVPDGSIKPVGTVWSYPLYTNDQLPALTASAADTSFVAFGNMKNLWIGTKNEMKLSVSTEASVTINTVLTSAFENNFTVIRAEARRSLALALPAAFAKLTTAAA